jgi:hypothetical protein
MHWRRLWRRRLPRPRASRTPTTRNTPCTPNPQHQALNKHTNSSTQACAVQVAQQTGVSARDGRPGNPGSHLWTGR